jgi:hypothetical protein
MSRLLWRNTDPAILYIHIHLSLSYNIEQLPSKRMKDDTRERWDDKQCRKCETQLSLCIKLITKHEYIIDLIKITHAISVVALSSCETVWCVTSRWLIMLKLILILLGSGLCWPMCASIVEIRLTILLYSDREWNAYLYTYTTCHFVCNDHHDFERESINWQRKPCCICNASKDK